MVRFGITEAAGRWRALLPAFVRRTANHLLLWPVLLGLSVLQISSGAAEENDGETDFAQFSAHDEASKIVIDYGPWNIVLRSLIRVTGPSIASIRD